MGPIEVPAQMAPYIHARADMVSQLAALHDYTTGGQQQPDDQWQLAVEVLLAQLSRK
jgi:hypothetical protein